MQDDMQRLIEFKNELELMIEEQQKEIEERSNKAEEILEALRMKEQEELHRNGYVDEIERQLKDASLKVKNQDQKMRRLKQGKMTEMQKVIKEKQDEIFVLKDMIVSGKSELKTKDITIKKLKNRIANLERINGIRG